MHLKVGVASKGGQAGCALWAFSGLRGLWEGVGIRLGWPECARRGWGCE